jgi:non-ribosomal peptide synthetase component F
MRSLAERPYKERNRLHVLILATLGILSQRYTQHVEALIQVRWPQEGGGFFSHNIDLDLSGNPDFETVVDRTTAAVNNIPSVFPVGSLFVVPENLHSQLTSSCLSRTKSLASPPEDTSSSVFSFTARIGRIVGELGYSVSAIDDRTARQLASHFANLLRHGLQDGRTPIYRLQMLDERDVHHLTIGLNDTARANVLTCIHEAFEHSATNQRDAAALFYLDQTLTYGELNTKANRLADYLCSEGLRLEPQWLCLAL